MRPVDMSSHMVIKPGLDWPFDTQVPNSKNMIPLLERNESLVTWLQPCKGEIKDQFPVIKMGSRFYTLSLRQMKVRQPPLYRMLRIHSPHPQALWKHIRLKKNFVNRETIPHVGGETPFIHWCAAPLTGLEQSSSGSLRYFSKRRSEPRRDSM